MSASALVIVAFICVGFFHVDSDNWNSPPGFFAHGFCGMMSGAAVMMSAFASIDNLASCAEESRTPCKSLPTAFTFVMSILFFAIIFVTLALTLATPWQQLSDNAALARAYEMKGIFAGNYVIGFGAVFGLFPVIIGSFMRPVRLMHSMSTDNLLPRIFSSIAFHGVPIVSHVSIGVCISLCALFLDLSTLLDVSSVATIMQFILSSIILLYIRYQPLPVGITREYSESDLTMIGEEAVDAMPPPEISSKFVLLENGEHNIQRSDESCYTSKDIPPRFSGTTVTAKGVRLKTSTFPSANNDSYQQVWPSALTSICRIQNPKQKIFRTNISPEKESLKNGYLDCGSTTYGLTDSCRTGRTDTNISYAQIRDSAQKHTRGSKMTQTLNVTLIEKVRSVHTNIGNSLIAVWSPSKLPADEKTWKLTRYFLLLYILASACFSIISQGWYSQLVGTCWVVTLTCISLGLMVISTLIISRQPQNAALVYFKTPRVPLVPLTSVILNMLLLASLPVITWVRFVTWFAPGIVIYFCYSYSHSLHRNLNDQEVILFSIRQLPSIN